MAIYVKDEGKREPLKSEQKQNHQSLMHYMMGMDDEPPMGGNVDYSGERNAPSDVAARQPQGGIPPVPPIGPGI